jgi:hypothetical protein
MLEGLVEDGYTIVFGGHYPPPHKEGNPHGYASKDSRALDHTTFLTERAFIRSLPIEFQEFAMLHHMFHVFLDLNNGPHVLTNDKGGHVSRLENFLKVISPANRKAWEDSKDHMIKKIIVDEIVECYPIGMRVFSFGKLVCEYFPKYLRLAQELAVKEASVILGRCVKYDIIFPSEKTGELPSVGGKIKCGYTELQHVCMADKFMSLDHHAHLD